MLLSDVHEYVVLSEPRGPPLPFCFAFFSFLFIRRPARKNALAFAVLARASRYLYDSLAFSDPFFRPSCLSAMEFEAERVSRALRAMRSEVAASRGHSTYLCVRLTEDAN